MSAVHELAEALPLCKLEILMCAAAHLHSSPHDMHFHAPDSLDENGLGAEGGKAIAAALPSSKVTAVRCAL